MSALNLAMVVNHDYFSMTTSTLLDCFAGGEATPGVGTATGLAGAIAASLAETAAQISYRHKICAAFHPRALQIQTRARQLRTILFKAANEDAAVFSKVFETRVLRDQAAEAEKPYYDNIAKELLVPACKVLLQIAEAGTEIVSLGAELYKSGYKTVRGDSITVVTLGVASVEGSLLVVERNIKLRKRDDEWSAEKRLDVERLWAWVTAERATLPLVL